MYAAESLIKAGLKVDTPNSEGTYILICLNIKLMEFGLHYKGETSVHEACKINNLDMAEMIFSHSLQLSAKDAKY